MKSNPKLFLLLCWICDDQDLKYVKTNNVNPLIPYFQ